MNISNGIKKTLTFVCNKCIHVSPYFILGWYFFCMFVALYDKTISENLKIWAEIINFMTFSIALRVIILEFENPTIFEFSTSIALIFWFIYYTPKDASNSGYPLITHLFYVSIDILTIIFLFHSFIRFLGETTFFSKQGKKIDDLYKCVLAFVFSFAIFMYSKCISLHYGN
jgi:hypothetical protein